MTRMELGAAHWSSSVFTIKTLVATQAVTQLSSTLCDFGSLLLSLSWARGWTCKVIGAVRMTIMKQKELAWVRRDMGIALGTGACSILRGCCALWVVRHPQS